MYWWNHAASLVRAGRLKRFGFVSTNSIRQTFNRRVLQEHLKAASPVSILFVSSDTHLYALRRHPELRTLPPVI
jgi:hypothetical protein